MLRQRILTAVILIVVVVTVILMSSGPIFYLMTAIFVSAAAWEWAGLSGISKWSSKLSYTILLVLSLTGVLLLSETPLEYFILISGLFLWCIAAILVVLYQKGRNKFPKSIWPRLMIGLFILIPPWVGLTAVHTGSNGAYLVLLLLTLIWFTDSAAFFIGSRWGKHRLASRISPSKSWEGVAGGLVLSIIPVVIYAILKEIHGQDFIWLLILCLITAGFSVIGDLTESVFKREADMKDSGTLLPGHGGVLDRIDSLAAAIPVYATGIWLLGGRV